MVEGQVAKAVAGMAVQRSVVIDAVAHAGDDTVLRRILQEYRATFAERLRAWRERRGMTISSLAKAAGVDRAQLSRIAGGRVQKPQTDTIFALAQVLGVHPRDLEPERFGQGEIKGRLDRIRRTVELLDAWQPALADAIVSFVESLIGFKYGDPDELFELSESKIDGDVLLFTGRGGARLPRFNVTPTWHPTTALTDYEFFEHGAGIWTTTQGTAKKPIAIPEVAAPRFNERALVSKSDVPEWGVKKGDVLIVQEPVQEPTDQVRREVFEPSGVDYARPFLIDGGPVIALAGGLTFLGTYLALSRDRRGVAIKAVPNAPPPFNKYTLGILGRDNVNVLVVLKRVITTHTREHDEWQASPLNVSFMVKSHILAAVVGLAEDPKAYEWLIDALSPTRVDDVAASDSEEDTRDGYDG